MFKKIDTRSVGATASPLPACLAPTRKPYLFAIAIILGVGLLAAGIVGVASYCQVGALSHVPKSMAITLMVTGGAGSALLSIGGVVGVVTSGQLHRRFNCEVQQKRLNNDRIPHLVETERVYDLHAIPSAVTHKPVEKTTDKVASSADSHPIQYEACIDKVYEKRTDLGVVQKTFDAFQENGNVRFKVLWGCDEPDPDLTDPHLDDEPVQEKEAFVEFIRQAYGLDAHNHWKIHVSVDPKDVPRAWNLIFPLLYEQAYAFKVVKMSLLKKRLEDVARNLLKNEEERFQVCLTKFQDLRTTELAACAAELSTLPLDCSQLPTLQAQKESIQDRREFWEAFDCKVQATECVATTEQLHKAQESTTRLYEGLQFTIYVPKGKEAEHKCLIASIEKRLGDHGVQPGTIYATDKPKGIFCSIRHPGSTYTAGIDAETYNPVNLPDPF